MMSTRVKEKNSAHYFISVVIRVDFKILAMSESRYVPTDEIVEWGFLDCSRLLIQKIL